MDSHNIRLTKLRVRTHKFIETYKRYWNYFTHVIVRNNRLNFNLIRTSRYKSEIKIVGITRIRNEELIIKDTLDHMGKIVDRIVVFDDHSNDNTVKICIDHPAVSMVIINKRWRKNRLWEETANRQKLYKTAKRLKPEWFFYFDADERFDDISRESILKTPPQFNGIKIRLFDAYLTIKDQNPYLKGELLNHRTLFGPEERDILMLWRSSVKARYIYEDSRDPKGNFNSTTNFYCQHFGKSLSIEHWEETCNYYVENFPKYRDKWEERKGKAIHSKSDFNNRLYGWNEIKDNQDIRVKI